MSDISLENNNINFKHVDGEHYADIVLFALSTCGWCKRTRMDLEVEEIEYKYVYADLTEGDEREECLEILSKFNEDQSFPTLVLDNGKKVIIGYEPDELNEYLGIED